MGKKHQFVHAIIIKALFFFLACFITTKINAQSINFISTQNALPQLDERIVKAGNTFNMQILNQQLVSGKRYKLSLTIKGRGIELKSAPDWYPKPIVLNGEPILNLISYDLAPYFDIENLDFSGYSKEDYALQGGLPDGSYNVCFQLYDNTSDAFAPVGNKSCVVMWAKKEDVPKITNPTRNPTIDQNVPYNFTWMPRHTSGGIIAYDFEIYEDNSKMSYNDIILYNSPVLKTTTSIPSHLLNANNNVLKRGRKYFCIVKANATVGGTVFKNGGYSEPEYFSYGFSPKMGRSSASDQCATYYLCWEDFAQSIRQITSISLLINGSPTQITFDPPVISASGYAELVARTLEALDALSYDGGFVENDPTIDDCSKGPSGVPGLFFTSTTFQFTSINGIPSGQSQTIQIPFNSTNAVDCNCTPGAPCDVDTDCFISGTYDASCNCVGIPIISNNFTVEGSTLTLKVKCTTTLISWSSGQQNVTSITPFDPNECYTVSLTCNDGCSYVFEYGQTCGECVLGEPCDDNDICTVNDKINEDCECSGQPVSNVYFYETPEGLVAKTNCTSATFLWSTGSTSNQITDFDPEQCYSVTVTCDIECILVGYYGEGCDCTPGTVCNDNSYCTVNDVYNNQCECIGVPVETVIFGVNNGILSSTVNCDGPLEYLWSNGATTPTVPLSAVGNPCYTVTITCDNECAFIGNYGTDCGCVVGAPCPGGGPCLYAGVYDAECNCPEPTPIPDTDGDGICDCAPGTVCNDFNYCTDNDRYNEQCECIGVPAETVSFGVTNGTLSSTVSCDGPLEYLWSNGATTPTVPLSAVGNPCYTVTITCDNGCVFIGNYGTNCGCVVGTPCPDKGPCKYVGVYNAECKCPEPIPLPDSDGDGICDPLDPCPGGPNEDFDNDGILDCTETDTDIDCGNFNPNITSRYIDPGTCDFMVNLDELLGNQSYINITNVNMHVGGQTYVIDESNSELPVCYGKSVGQSFTQSYDDFETDEINWIGLQPFVKRVKNDILNGNYCMRIKGGSEFSFMSLPTFGIAGMNMVNINFSYVTEDFKTGEKFILQASYNNGQTYQDLQTYTYGSSFQNNVSKSIVFNHVLNDQTQIKLRIINASEDEESQSKLYIDDIKIIKSAASCDKKVAAEELRLIIEKWLLYSNQFSGKVSVVYVVNDEDPLKCPNKGIQILVSDANIHFDLISGQNGINTGQQSFCKLACQGEIVQGQESILSVTNVNCSNATYLWSDGSTTSSIRVNSPIAKYFVTVTCGNGCSKVLVSGTGDCAYGQFCTDPCLVGGVGYYDAFCNCVGTQLLDSDGDGICDEEDPCPTDANLNCAEPCKENTLLFTVKDEDKTVCDKCVSINSFVGENLYNVEVSTPNGQIKLSNEPGFSFPYCYELTESFCTSGEFLSDEYSEMASIKQFTFDFYLWAKKNNPDVFVKIDKTDGCAQNGAPSITFGNVDFISIKLLFKNGALKSQDITPCKQVFDYRILAVRNDALPNCQPLSYLWSDGSTTPTIILKNKKAGASVTVTCPGLKCPLTGIINEDYCIVGTPCNDYNECTVNDTYNNACVCIGEMDADDDRDSVGNACDECPDKDDTIDVDGDGIPDCKEECNREEVEQCSYCVDLMPKLSSDCYSVNAFSYINSNNNIVYLSIDVVSVCVSNIASLNTLVNNINNALTSNNIGGTATLTQGSCSPLGFSITIVGAKFKLGHLFGKDGGATIKYPFKETCETVLETACDDGDPCTINDVYDEYCNCKGVFQDKDNDLVCDEYDVCPEYPDGLDINENGVPDCKEPITLKCDRNEVPLCTYLFKYADCDKMETVDLMLAQEALIEFMEEADWNPINMNIGSLISQLQAISIGNGGIGIDDDGDGLINFLDPCPEHEDSEFIYTGKEINDFCSDPYNDGIRNYFLSKWIYTPINTFDDKGNPPPCIGPNDDQGDFKVREITFDTDDDVLLVFDGGMNDGASVKISVDCDCKCKVECLHDIDQDGKCDENDDDIVICDNPPCYPCITPGCVVGTETNPDGTIKEIIDVCPGGACPETDPCHYYLIEDCVCRLYSYRDSDNDQVCDILDQCEGDDLDLNLNGIVDCLDLCSGPVENHKPNPDIITPIGPGDPCDDGNPCTYADALNASCYCEGVIVDVDDDGVDDCAECKVFFIDPDVVGAPAVEITTGGPYINCAGCYYVSGNINNPDTKCDMCPGLPELDYNKNGVPDCLDPPYYEVGCPSGYSIIEGVGLVLIFDADKIRVEDIPNPIRVFGTSSTSGTLLFTNDYVTLANTREVDGTYEVLYPYSDLPNNLNTLLVSFSGGQPCPLINNEDPLVDVICPQIFIDAGNILLYFDYPSELTPDLFSFTGEMLVDGNFTVNNQNTPWSTPLDIELSSITSSFSQMNGGAYSIILNNALAPTLSNAIFSGSITLPNGIVCNYEPGTGVLSPCPAPNGTSYPGMPCDCDPTVMDCACYTHFRLDNNCNCIGDPKPDFDGDGICDEFDTCPEEENVDTPDNDGDGRPDCPCPVLQLAAPGENQTNPTLINGSDLSINFDIPDPSIYTGATVTITGGPSLLPIEMPLTSPLIIPNLPKGYSFTITIKAQCATGGTSSIPIEVDDVPFESNPMFCGISLAPIDPSTYTLLPTLKRGDVFKAANFNIFVQEASGSYGKFSGKGYIQVPYFNQLRVNVSFSNITVTAAKQMIVGYILVSGYGVSVLGEPMSSDINEWTNEIINDLTEISEVLEVLIPLLEASEELVKASEKLLSAETLRCLNEANAELKALEIEAKSENPAPSEARKLEIVQEIKEWNIKLKKCKDDADAELAPLMTKLIELVDHSAFKINSECELSNNNFQGYEAVKTFPTTKLNNAISKLGNILATGTIEMDQFSMANPKLDTLNIIFDSSLYPDYSDIKSFYDNETEKALCHFMGMLNNESLDKTFVLALTQALLLSGNDFIAIFGDQLKSNNTVPVIYQGSTNGILNSEIIKQIFSKHLFNNFYLKD